MKKIIVAIGAIISAAIFIFSSAADAQTMRVYRIGVLGLSPVGFETDAHQCPIVGNPNWQAIIAGLEDHGYFQRRNLALECRWTDGQAERGPLLAAELVKSRPDLLLALGTAQVRWAKEATATIPIIMADVIDPVRRGLVAGLARPGGNVTGFAGTLGELEGKRLQLIKEVVPEASRVAVLGQPEYGPAEDWIGAYLLPAASTLRIALRSYDVQGTEFEAVFKTISAAADELLYVMPIPVWLTGDPLQKIPQLALQNRLPSVYQDRRFVEAGGLMSYSADNTVMRRRMGSYVDKILKGANPGDLPIEQPTKFNLVINLKTAAALGLTIPPSLLLLADEVIQ